MKSFSDFMIDETMLKESLNSAQEYYMTDDTVIPTEIYAAFAINEKSYVIALVQTKVEGVYILQAGKNTGGKTMWWRFHEASDIVPVLSTVLHFAESSMFMLGPKIKGVAIQMQTAASIDRAVRMAELMIKKTFITTMKYVPLIQPPESDKDYITYQKLRFVFFVKKNVDVHGLFKGSEFNKYDFGNVATGPIPAAAAPKVSVPVKAVASLKPKKVVKVKTSVEPSTKYSFNNFAVDTPYDLKDIQKINKYTAQTNVTSPTTPKAPPSMPTPDLSMNIALAGAMESMPTFASLINKLKTFGYDENKISWTDFKHVIDNNTSAAEKEILMDVKLYPFKQSDDYRWKLAMGMIADNHKNSTFSSTGLFANIKKETAEFIAKHNGVIKSTTATIMPSSSSGSTPVIKAKIPFAATLKGSGNGSITYDITNQVFVEVGQKVGAKVEHLSETLGYHDKIGNSKNLFSIRDYSGSNYPDYNNPLRKVVAKLFDGDKMDPSFINKVLEDNGILDLYKAFEDIDPVPESFWVFRGTYIPSNIRPNIVAGHDLVDPAFLSTTLDPSGTFGGDKLAIFIPKGSRVLPILQRSKSPGEKEVLLPPSSVLRVIDKQNANSYGDILAIRTIYMGSAHKSILETLTKKLTEEYDYDSVKVMKRIIEAMTTKTQKEIANSDKFTSQHDDEVSKAIAAAIKAGKLKLTK